jgi:outer membrane lipoprotein
LKIDRPRRAGRPRGHWWYRFACTLLGVILIAGCASPVPEMIRTFPSSGPTVSQVKGDIGRFVGTRVRWGGSIAVVDNRPSRTSIEIVARPLEKNGRPVVDDVSRGRFRAQIGGFLDPAIYAEDRLLTVVGTIQGEVTRAIGDYQYRFPVVAVESYYLWEQLDYRCRYDPYAYWWYRDPWYPYGYPWGYGPYCW